jgi:hypothetical protein
MSSGTNTTQALQDRIAAARQRLRTAQLSLFESLDRSAGQPAAAAPAPSSTLPRAAQLSPTRVFTSTSANRESDLGPNGAREEHAATFSAVAEAAGTAALLDESDEEDSDSQFDSDSETEEGALKDHGGQRDEDGQHRFGGLEEQSKEAARADEFAAADGGGGDDPVETRTDSVLSVQDAVDGLIKACSASMSSSALGGRSSSSSTCGLPPPRELFNFAAAVPGSDNPSAEPLPPRMRTGYAMLHPPPVHIADEPPLPEPLRPNPKLEELVASLMALDAERLQNPLLSMNRVAYDAFDPIDLATNLFVREDCLNTVLPAIDAPLGEAGAVPLMGAPAAAPASAAAGSDPDPSPRAKAGAGAGEIHHHHATRAAAAAAAAATGTGTGTSTGTGGGPSGDMSSNLPRGDPTANSTAPSAESSRRSLPRGPVPLNHDTLVFESRFESGNLRRAVQVSAFEYDLILRPDLNTRGHTQWFYFAVANAQRGVTYKFNILNMVKPDSLFNFGMQPLVYSTQEAALRGTGWRRRGHDVAYYQNHIKRRNGYYYTLSFKLRVLHASDVNYIAYTHPYTCTDLNRYLRNLEKDPTTAKRFRRRPLCETLSGNTIEMLTVTSFASDPEAINKRKGVVISARVHPGESNASFMMQGIIDYLTGPSLDAKILRDNFVFKLVPMLNVDGVVVGNYRCSLAGLDLNRMWRDPSRRLTPTIYATKLMLKRLQEDREVVLFCDLHGHSRKHNVFCYGCEPGKDVPPGPRRYAEMVFPRMLWRNSPVFSFSDCSFKISRQKEGTGRVVVRRELGIVNSFTMEASLAGPNFGRLAGTHYGPAALRGVGHAFCDTILDYFDPDPVKRDAVTDELRMLFPNGIGGDGNDSDGSDGNPEEDCLEQVSVPWPHSFLT